MDGRPTRRRASADARATQLAAFASTAALVCDCLVALDPFPPPHEDSAVPSPSSSLRASAMVSVAFVALPTIARHSVTLATAQHLLGLTVCVVLAFAGSNVASSATRAFEGIYVGLCGISVIAPAASKGLERLFDANVPSDGRTSSPPAATGTVALSERASANLVRRVAPTLALLAYGGGRIFRAGAVACRVAQEGPSGRGHLRIALGDATCVACDALASASATAMGGTCIATVAAALWCVANDSFREARAVVVVGTATAVVATTILLYSSVGNLSLNPRVFSSSPLLPPECTSLDDAGCTDRLMRARRLGVCIWPITQSILSVVSLCGLVAGMYDASGVAEDALSVAEDAGDAKDEASPRRAAGLLSVPIRALRSWVRLWFRAWTVDTFAVVGVCLVFVVLQLWSTEWHGNGVHVEGVAVAVVVGIAVMSAIDELTGALVVYAALYVDIVIDFHTFDHAWFTYFTNVSNMAMMLGFVLYVVLRIVGMLEMDTAVEARIRYTRDVTCQSMRSLATALALATCAGIALYDGRDIRTMIRYVSDERVSAYGMYHRSGSRFLVWHYAPVVTWTLLQNADRSAQSHRALGQYSQWGAWLVSTGSVAIAYSVALGASETSVPLEYPVTEVLPAVVCGVFVVGFPFLLAC